MRLWIVVNCDMLSIMGVFSLFFLCLRLLILFNVGFVLVIVLFCIINLIKGFFLGLICLLFWGKDYIKNM